MNSLYANVSYDRGIWMAIPQYRGPEAWESPQAWGRDMAETWWKGFKHRRREAERLAAGLAGPRRTAHRVTCASTRCCTTRSSCPGEEAFFLARTLEPDPGRLMQAVDGIDAFVREIRCAYEPLTSANGQEIRWTPGAR